MALSNLKKKKKKTLKEVVGKVGEERCDWLCCHSYLTEDNFLTRSNKFRSLSKASLAWEYGVFMDISGVNSHPFCSLTWKAAKYHIAIHLLSPRSRIKERIRGPKKEKNK